MRYGFALYAGTAPEIIRASAREAEGLGYNSFWVNHPGVIDGLAALALAARATQRSRLGIGVIPLNTRGPDSIVRGVGANDLPLDRLLLGVGSANPGALRRVREGVTDLRARLPVRIVVAALGPQLCRLGGEVADAVLFNWLTPEHARLSADLVRAGAAAVGRHPPELFAYVRVALGPVASSRLREEAASYAAIPAYANHFARMRVTPMDAAIPAQSPEAIPPELGKWQGAVDEVVIRAITGADAVGESLALLRAAKPG
jgi:alkanesulfonate monooxygenase SsuD/methylene tetrahydromethanopterin reductase-like flavin-dependent oxidoreductase (luciferase family)